MPEACRPSPMTPRAPGDSPPRLVPPGMGGLARQAAHVLDALGHPDADVLGVSFGGAVAQQLTLDNPHRVRRLVLASTTCGIGGVPGHPVAVALLATPLRYYSPSFFRRTAGLLYGPVAAHDEQLFRVQTKARRARPPSLWGYVGQLAATAGWSSLPWLHRIRKPTLVLSGAADPSSRRSTPASWRRGSPAPSSKSCPAPGICS